MVLERVVAGGELELREPQVIGRDQVVVPAPLGGHWLVLTPGAGSTWLARLHAPGAPLETQGAGLAVSTVAWDAGGHSFVFADPEGHLGRRFLGGRPDERLASARGPVTALAASADGATVYTLEQGSRSSRRLLTNFGARPR